VKRDKRRKGEPINLTVGKVYEFEGSCLNNLDYIGLDGGEAAETITYSAGVRDLAAAIRKEIWGKVEKG